MRARTMSHGGTFFTILCAVTNCVVVGGGMAPAWAAESKHPTYTDPAKSDADFLLQGEYAGEISVDGQSMRFGLQVVAEGDGRFAIVGYPGGLPGDGWQSPNKLVGHGTREGQGTATVVKLEGVDWEGNRHRGLIRDGAMVVLDDDGREIVKLPRVERKSPTLGMKPPQGAVVIFDGSGTDGVEGRMSEDGLLMQGVTSKATHGDATLHIEFRLPYQPFDRGQGRGNSGAYVHGCYEVQMLDSFGLEGKDNECGGIYRVAPPRVNMCLPPLTWQTYDIDFTAPRFEGEKKVANARMTVRHNGVVIHDDLELSEATPGGKNGEGAMGPLFLQDHGNPVRYRNIWFVPKS